MMRFEPPFRLLVRPRARCRSATIRHTHTLTVGALTARLTRTDQTALCLIARTHPTVTVTVTGTATGIRTRRLPPRSMASQRLSTAGGGLFIRNVFSISSPCVITPIQFHPDPTAHPPTHELIPAAGLSPNDQFSPRKHVFCLVLSHSHHART